MSMYRLYQRIQRYQHDLQRIPWLSLVGYGLWIVFNGMLVSLFLPAAWRGALVRVLFTLPLILVVAKDIVCFRVHMMRVLTAFHAKAKWSQKLYALVPPGFLAYLRLERSMWCGVYFWLMRRGKPNTDLGERVHYLEKGAYETMTYIVMIVLFFEIPFDVLITSVIAKSSSQTSKLHWVFGLLSVYSFIWLMGDRWHVLGSRYHRLTATHLILTIGPRADGMIPLEAIANCERLHESRREWCRKQGYSLYATREITPFDAPNVVLTLHRGSDVQLSLLQSVSGGDGPIFLYVDCPDLLITALHVKKSGALAGRCHA